MESIVANPPPPETPAGEDRVLTDSGKADWLPGPPAGPTETSKAAGENTGPHGHPAHDRHPAWSSGSRMFDAAITPQELGSPEETAAPAEARDVLGAALVASDTAAPERAATIRLSLDEPGLGSIRIHMVSTPEGVTGRLTVRDNALRLAIQSQIGAIRQVLAQAGVRLGSFEIQAENGDPEGELSQARETAVPPREPRRGRPTRETGAPLLPSAGVDVVV